MGANYYIPLNFPEDQVPTLDGSVSILCEVFEQPDGNLIRGFAPPPTANWDTPEKVPVGYSQSPLGKRLKSSDFF